MEEREEGKFQNSSSGNSVINNQELSDDTSAQQEGRSSAHSQKINTGQKQGEICNNLSLLLGETTASPLPPPPPPPALKPPTSRIRSILSNSVWMMKEIQHDNH